jgi:CO/xanthine dehydrogenase Mo-binding subunit
MGLSVVGESVLRVDVLEKVTGRAIFCDDIRLPGMLHAKVLRSPYPHAKILNIDTSKAERLSGVRCVITNKDVPPNRYGVTILDQYVLAKDVVRYVGDPLAAVAADTMDIAEEALELIDVEYEELPAIFDGEEAMSTNPSVIIHPELASYEIGRAWGLGPDPDRPNVFARFRILRGDVDKGFKESDLVLENRFSTSKIQHCPLEPHVAIGQPMANGDLTLWVGRQGIWRMRNTIAPLFDMNPSRIRVVQSYVGGGFGQKNRVVVEPIVIVLALKTKHPVKLLFTREEVFLHGSKVPMVIYIKDGVKKDGTLVARKMKVILKAGPYDYNIGLVNRNCAFGVAGTYRVPNVKWESYGVYSNEPPACGFRGLGSNQTVWAVESHMDIVAGKLGIDPMEFRKRNILKEGEPNIYGELTHSIGARQCLDRMAEFIKLDQKPKGEGPWRIGKGIALGNKYSLAPTTSLARVKVGEDGTITVFHSADEIGQGCNTVAAQIAAEEFGVPISKVRVVFTDTLITPFFDGGSTSSRVTYNLGNAVILACRAAKKNLFERAAERLGTSPDELETKGGEVHVREETSKKITIPELFTGYKGDRPGGYGAWTRGGEIVGDDTWVQEYTPEDPETGQINPIAASQGKRLVAFYGHMGKAVELAVNVDTGQVKILRCGMAIDSQPINPKMCEQQMEGGMGMAIGETLFEEVRLENGRVTNPNFTDYRIPTTTEMPSLDNVKDVIAPTPHKDGPFGAKGFSEGAMVGLQPAIANAIEDAIGVRIRDLPITPERVLQALKKGEREE